MSSRYKDKHHSRGNKSSEGRQINNSESSNFRHGKRHKGYNRRTRTESMPGCSSFYRHHKVNHNKYSSQSTHCSDNSQRTNDEGEADELEIPGFYYDKRKNKYFKILPDHSCSVSGSITNEILQEQNVERKRQKDLYMFHKTPVVTLGQIGKNPLCLCSHNSFHVNIAYRLGLRSSLLSKSVLREIFIKRLMTRAKTEVSSSGVEDVKRMILSPDAKSLVALWSLKEQPNQKLQKFHIKPTRRLDAVGNIKFKTAPSRALHEFVVMKGTALCWAPSQEERDHTARVLFTYSSVHDSARNTACLYNMDSLIEENSANYYSLGQMSWSCAWNPRGSQFTVGLETHVLLVDVETKKKLKLCADGSAVYAITVSQQNNKIMYSGTRKGNIFTHDLRGHFGHSATNMSHHSGIAHVYLASDECSLTASDVSGQIKMWDLRQRRVIKEYPGHVNQYVQQPFFVDADENFLFAVGQDCYTRIWNYQTSSLLHTIPAPHPVSVHSIPQIAYSDHIGGPRGLPGLLLTSKGEFHLYAF